MKFQSGGGGGMCLAEDGKHVSVTHKSLLGFCATPPRRRRVSGFRIPHTLPPAGLVPQNEKPPARFQSAEREGFEPSRPFRAWHISSVLVSTTHPPLLCRYLTVFPYLLKCFGLWVSITEKYSFMSSIRSRRTSSPAILE